MNHDPYAFPARLRPGTPSTLEAAFAIRSWATTRLNYLCHPMWAFGLPTQTGELPLRASAGLRPDFPHMDSSDLVHAHSDPRKEGCQRTPPTPTEKLPRHLPVHGESWQPARPRLRLGPQVVDQRRSERSQPWRPRSPVAGRFVISCDRRLQPMPEAQGSRSAQ
jgi:hypothetical protein